ncbi:hypothetical protein Asp14428_07760 [Actinoplanes sp. NBRC 14428]|nr:hypothetical protein Asp14428_07760 [Actinoplanes sp. NBRC 14428]
MLDVDHIVAALAALGTGAGEAAAGAAGRRLVERIMPRFAGRPEREALLEPQVHDAQWRALMRRALIDSRAAEDKEVRAAAERVLHLTAVTGSSAHSIGGDGTVVSQIGTVGTLTIGGPGRWRTALAVAAAVLILLLAVGALWFGLNLTPDGGVPPAQGASPAAGAGPSHPPSSAAPPSSPAVRPAAPDLPGGAVPAPGAPARPGPARHDDPPPATRRPTTPPAPAVTTTPPTSGKALDVSGDRWLDIDTSPPSVTVAGGSTDGVEDVDVQVGPNNLYPHNGAGIWVKQPAGTCTAQWRQYGSYDELPLSQKLEGRPGTPIAVCLYATSGNSYLLTISTKRVDGGAPYRIGYARD